MYYKQDNGEAVYVSSDENMVEGFSSGPQEYVIEQTPWYKNPWFVTGLGLILIIVIIIIIIIFRKKKMY